ncbi:hypothetical protein E2C01_039971 [Portunus trituberculatus]|uniref:Uncharacterized protein n=1 Tax=Portunus trituberculatus TaxID=210409 RepID=A0A5B7FLP7_PORTR|nr:hypothetical protein [Portunus trituberculatus]
MPPVQPVLTCKDGEVRGNSAGRGGAGDPRHSFTCPPARRARARPDRWTCARVVTQEQTAMPSTTAPVDRFHHYKRPGSRRSRVNYNYKHAP